MNSSTVWIFSDTSTSTTNQNKLRFKKKSVVVDSQLLYDYFNTVCSINDDDAYLLLLLFWSTVQVYPLTHRQNSLRVSCALRIQKYKTKHWNKANLKKKIWFSFFFKKIFKYEEKIGENCTSKTNFLSHSWMLASDFLWEWDQSYIRLPRMKGSPQSTLAILLSNVMKLILILLVGFSCLTFINAMPMCKWIISVFKSEFNNLFSVFSGFVAPDNNIEDNQDLFENFWKRTQMKKMFSPFSRMAANVISGLTSSGSSNLKLIRLP